MFMLVFALAMNAQTGTWKNDKAHTRIGFEVKHAGLSFVSGRFTDFDITVKELSQFYSVGCYPHQEHSYGCGGARQSFALSRLLRC